MKLRQAIKQAVKVCQEKNILVSFIKRYASEVENMLLTGWNTKDAMAFSRNRGREEGRVEGMQLGRIEARNELFALWESGVSLEDAKKQLKL